MILPETYSAEVYVSDYDPDAIRLALRTPDGRYPDRFDVAISGADSVRFEKGGEVYVAIGRRRYLVSDFHGAVALERIR